MPKIELLRRATGLPLDIYLIDDLEASCDLVGAHARARVTRCAELRVLRRASHVFAISPGYVEHLATKYQVRATWLPLAAEPVGEFTPFHFTHPDTRAIVFLGSVNPLYMDSLCVLYQEISQWNRQSGRPYELRLRLVTRFEPQHLIGLLPDRDYLELALNLDHAAAYANLKSAWALFLPYSFDPKLRVMVSTSFSHKFTESITVGRPILVFGPIYASIPRYFREKGLPLCAASVAELSEVLRDIPNHDGPTLIDSYRTLAEADYSPAAVRAAVTAAA